MDTAYYKEQLLAKEEMLAQTTRFLLETQRLLEYKNRELSDVNKDLLDSISFASIIQRSILPDEEILKVFFKDGSYRVKQQIGIGGDTVFIKNTNFGLVFGLFDSSGHGVPAALLSTSASLILKELIYAMEIDNTGDLLKLLNQQLYNTFRNSDQKIAQMEGVLFNYSSAENLLTYSSAKGKAFIVKMNGELIQLGHTKRSIGEDLDISFQTTSLKVEQGDKLFVYSDGLQDQFGGYFKKKFSSTRIRELLLGLRNHTARSIARQIEHEFEQWKGSEPQTDDMSFLIIDL
ncbi:MAG: PP2C family protein-serine/threonine phosphatase [Bacteroidia bacterium]